MQIFLGFVDRVVWEAIVNGLIIPTGIVNGAEQEKLYLKWTAEENKRAQFDVRARNYNIPCLGFR